MEPGAGLRVGVERSAAREQYERDRRERGEEVPLARHRTARNRDLRNATSRKLTATRLIRASVDSKIGLKASLRGSGTRANGISAQKTTNKAMATASARRRAPGGAGAVTRNAFDP